MPHPLTAYFCTCYFNTTAVADHTLITDGLEFTAETFPFLCGTEDPFTEQAVLFRAERTIVDGLRFFHFPV